MGMEGAFYFTKLEIETPKPEIIPLRVFTLEQFLNSNVNQLVC